MDDVQFVYKEGRLILEGKMKDETGEYEVKRTHELSEDANTYQYQHYRKYAGMSKWLLIDRFVAKRVK